MSAANATMSELRKDQVKRFGEAGELYTIVDPTVRQVDGRDVIRVLVIGPADEEFDYYVEDAINDPDAD